MNTWQLLPLVPIHHPADGNGAGKATESRWTTLTGEVRQDGCSKQKERWRKLSKVPLSSAAVGQEGVASHSLLPSVGVQGRRKRRGSRCSWRGEIVTSTLSAPQNPGWHFSLPSSRIPPYQLHVTADLQSGPISVNVRRWSPATAASPLVHMQLLSWQVTPAARTAQQPGSLSHGHTDEHQHSVWSQSTERRNSIAASLETSVRHCLTKLTEADSFPLL